MKSRASIQSHPIHPMLVSLPIGLWTTSLAYDLLSAAKGERRLRQTAQIGLHVDLPDMGMVESVHLSVFHWVLGDVFGRINRNGRYAFHVCDH